MKIDETYTVQYMMPIDKGWVFGKLTEDPEEASNKANSLWENPDLKAVRILKTTREVWKSKSR